jgi:hypothetical protein
MRWLAADSAERSASRVRAWPKSCGGAGETFPRSVWGYSSLFERNSVLLLLTSLSYEGIPLMAERAFHQMIAFTELRSRKYQVIFFRGGLIQAQLHGREPTSFSIFM